MDALNDVSPIDYMAQLGWRLVNREHILSTEA
jgi:hypothetical protein